MSIQETCGHLLKVGDKVRMNIPAIKAYIDEWGGDGVEFTATGKDYWRYMCEHPDEVYTIISLDFNYEDQPYRLSGYMADNSWGSDELIHVPEAESNFEIIKNMTIEEMAERLLPMLTEICEDGVPCKELMLDWLKQQPTNPA